MSDRKQNIHLPGLIILAVILFGLWLVFSAHFDVFHISAGVVAVIIVILLNYRLLRLNLYPEIDELNPPIRILRILPYTFWLIKEIFIANLQVAYLIIHPKMPIKPSMVQFTTKLPSTVAKVILGNSITLTPGTLTIDIDSDVFLVHSLTPSSAGSLESGEMQKRVLKLYGDNISQSVSDFQHLDNIDSEKPHG
ncbi:MAG: Na+/H+ antiporter subunit E [Bacteroidota bacterium]|nr:Na+/H+ antiporter subunit E [Bacteroidota bacterium]